VSAPLALGSVPTLSRGAHDRATHRRTDAAYLAGAWDRALVLPVRGDGTVPVVDAGDGPRLALRGPADPVVVSTVDGGGPRLFLGEHAGRPYFAVAAVGSGAAVVDGSERWVGLRAVGAALDDLGAGLVVTAVALAHWHARHPRCPRCGEPTVVTQAGWSRRCRNDGSEHWPRTDPAVIMLVHDGADRCILGRQASWPVDRFSILAGFVEPGESLEAAVVREVAEEVGTGVTDIRYLASQPWPFPASLMLGFSARVAGSPALRVDHAELAEARWCSRAELRAGAVRLPPPVSIAYRIITDWLNAG
jgi:NAD+ diphosphatase